MIDKPNLLIVTWHQVYLSSSAGGYVRLKEFLKRMPKSFRYILLDNKPTIYSKVALKTNIIEYDTPKFLKPIIKKSFVLWFFLESIFGIFVLYSTCTSLIKKKNISVIYFPVGEFIYITAVMLKVRFPKKKIVIDILNYGMEETPIASYKKLRKNGVGKAKSGSFVMVSIFQHFILYKCTIYLLDYIFTVSPELVKRIKKDYRKNSIDYTPSGVTKISVPAKSEKKFLGIYVGRITVEKGIFEILNAWKFVVRENPAALVAFAGSASDDMILQLKKKAKELGILKNIFIFNKPTDKEKFSLIANSQIFLHLAVYEPLFPVIGILEGLCMGLPVVIYDMNVVSSQKDLKNKEFIYIAKNGDFKMAAEKILTYEKLNENIKQQLSKDALLYAKLFDWDVIAKKEFKVIEGFIKENETN